MKPLVLDWNLGLGDAIICNGLVRVLAREYGPLRLPCYEHNLPSVRHMFSDLENVTVYSAVYFTSPVLCRQLSIGINNPGWKDCKLSFDRAFYHFAGVDFEARWSEFYVPPSDTEISPDPIPFALLHEDEGRGFVFDSKLRESAGLRVGQSIWVRPRTPILTDWRNMIEAASEIHCIDSSFMHLVESMPTTGKLFFHRYARPAEHAFNDFARSKKWDVID